tara:strand:+ start:821 stop:1921 length:1101 start_codon:yes stop_codon:yes gene_type:complete
MKKFKFYLILIFFILLLVELLCYFSLSIIKKKTLLKNFEKREYNPKVLEKYSEFIPYSRSKVNFNELNNYIVKNDDSYFYSVINEFNIQNKDNVLIQGDSWAELANKKKIFSFLKKISKKYDIGLINSGISSYSPSPMMSQLYILKKEFKIKPSIIIAIIDQTDLGDELYRYRNLNKNSLSPSLSKQHLNFYLDSNKKFQKTNSSIIKLIDYAYSYFLLNKSIYNLNNYETSLILFKKIKSKLFGVPIVLSPIKFGINDKEKNMFKSKLENYIDFAFKNENLNKIYFVTHPHLNHLNGEFKININSIIDEIIKNNKNTKNIKHIDFHKINKNISKDIFDKGDIFSHLTENAYINYFFPTVFSKIEF